MFSRKLLKILWNPSKTSIRHYPYPTEFKQYLQNCHPPPQYTKLPNGLTIATEEREGWPNACIGFFIDAGSRYECAYENGIAHFFEHIAFKSTINRNRCALEADMNSIGALFKCFTTREMAVYYVQCQSTHVPLAVDLLSDCVFNNALCPNEIESQKRTVYTEMLEHDHNVNEVLYDYLHTAAFQGTPLSQTVMGMTTNLYNFNPNTIRAYLHKFFNPSRTVMVGVGGIKHKQLEALACCYLQNLEPIPCVDKDIYRYTGTDIRYRDDSMPCGNVIVAVEGPCLREDNNLVMEVARQAVGSWDRSQISGNPHPWPLALEASSLKFCDAYKSFNISYKDTGLWGIQFIGDTMTLDDMCITIQDNWQYLCTCITESEVDRAKRVLKTKYLSDMQVAKKAMFDIGRWTLYNGSRPSLLDTINAIENIHASDVQRVCTLFLNDQCPTVIAIGKIEGLLEYARIRAGMYWLRT